MKRGLVRFAAAIAALVLSPAWAEVGPSPVDRALLDAARRGDASRIRALLRQGAGTDTRDESGLTPLMNAVPRPEAARLLLGAGADVNASTRSGWTALMQAASMGAVETARLLLEAGAGAEARDRLWGTALDVASRWRQPEVVRLLRERGARGSGRAVGDRVCVRPWNGEGFCGVIDTVEDNRLQIRIERIAGCTDGCASSPTSGSAPASASECSDGRTIGGPAGVAPGDSIWTKSWCLTHTGLR